MATRLPNCGTISAMQKVLYDLRNQFPIRVKNQLRGNLRFWRIADVQPSDDVGEEQQSDLRSLLLFHLKRFHTCTIPRCCRGHSGLFHAPADGFEAGDE